MAVVAVAAAAVGVGAVAVAVGAAGAAGVELHCLVTSKDCCICYSHMCCRPYCSLDKTFCTRCHHYRSCPCKCYSGIYSNRYLKPRLVLRNVMFNDWEKKLDIPSTTRFTH